MTHLNMCVFVVRGDGDAHGRTFLRILLPQWILCHWYPVMTLYWTFSFQSETFWRILNLMQILSRWLYKFSLSLSLNFCFWLLSSTCMWILSPCKLSIGSDHQTNHRPTNTLSPSFPQDTPPPYTFSFKLLLLSLSNTNTQNTHRFI